MVGDTLGQLNLRPMAVRTEGTLLDVGQVEAVRRVAVGADRLRGVKRAIGASFFVAARAPKRELRHAPRMGIVAGDAVTLVFDDVRRGDVFVTALAASITSGANRVRLVTAAAIPVLAGSVLSEDTLPLVAALATRGARRGKRVGFMAVDTSVVSARKDCSLGHTRLLVRMALHACRRVGRELVPAVTISAGSTELRAAVLNLE